MIYKQTARVMYENTDSYKVVWHGSYLRWLEEGRFNICCESGIDLIELEKTGITFPIVDMHVRYKTPAVIFEEIIIETKITEVKTRSITFTQTIKNKDTEEIHVTAEIVCVMVNMNNQKLQKFPQNILSAFQKVIENNTNKIL